jgi:hypothetical protein
MHAAMKAITDNVEYVGELLLNDMRFPSIAVFRDECSRGTVRVRGQLTETSFPTHGLVMQLSSDTNVPLERFRRCEAQLCGEVHYHFDVARRNL